MSDDSQSNSQPRINIISIASDDDLWVLQTDQNELIQVLSDPVGWVSANVTIKGAPAVLWQPFVVVFQKIAAAGTDPTINVQGINETALLTVQYAPIGQSGQIPAPLFPPNTTNAILQVGSTIYTHLELTGFTPAQVANTLLTSVTTPNAYFAAFNALPQTLNGVPVPPASQMKFMANQTTPIQYTYEGWTPQPAPPPTVKEVVMPEDDTSPLTCMMSIGDCDAQGNVWVNNVIVKTYSPSN